MGKAPDALRFCDDLGERSRNDHWLDSSAIPCKGAGEQGGAYGPEAFQHGERTPCGLCGFFCGLNNKVREVTVHARAGHQSKTVMGVPLAPGSSGYGAFGAVPAVEEDPPPSGATRGQRNA